MHWVYYSVLVVFIVTLSIYVLHKAYKTKRLIFCPCCKTLSSFLTMSFDKKYLSVCQDCVDNQLARRQTDFSG